VFYITTQSAAAIVERRWSVNELEQWRNAAVRVTTEVLGEKTVSLPPSTADGVC